MTLHLVSLTSWSPAAPQSPGHVVLYRGRGRRRGEDFRVHKLRQNHGIDQSRKKEAYEQVITSITGLISRVDTLMSTINERLAQSRLSPLERKLARQRPSFLARDVLDKVVKEHTAYFRAKANENDPQP